MRVEPVEPLAFVQDASDLLMAAWPRPCVNYSAEYLAWQFGFPGALVPLAVAAFAGSVMIGFVAAMNRRLRFADQFRDVYLCSFLAVHPDYRGPVAFALLRRLIKLAKPTGAPVLGFTDPSGLSEDVCRDCFVCAGYRHARIWTYKSFGAAVTASNGNGFIVEKGSIPELETFYGLGDSSDMIRNAPTSGQLEYYLTDPRGREMVIVRTSGDRTPLAAVQIFCSEIATRAGVTKAVTLDSVYAPGVIRAEHVGAVVRHASQLWSDRVENRLVMASNIAGLDAATIRAAGFRETPGAPTYNGYLFAPDPDDALFAARLTNLEVV